MVSQIKKSSPTFGNIIKFKSTYENHLKMEKSETKHCSNAYCLIISIFLTTNGNESSSNKHYV